MKSSAARRFRWIQSWTDMLTRPVLIGVLLTVVSACSRSPAVSSLCGASEKSRRSVVPSDRSSATGAAIGAEIGGGFSHEAAIKNIERLMAGFGMRLAHSPEDDRLTTVVDEHMRKARTPMPDNHRFVISRRTDGWAVSVCDIESFLRAERPRCEGAYHVEDSRGRLRLLYIEAAI